VYNFQVAPPVAAAFVIGEPDFLLYCHKWSKGVIFSNRTKLLGVQRTIELTSKVIDQKSQLMELRSGGVADMLNLSYWLLRYMDRGIRASPRE
jgi:hypothetical protein